MHMYHRLDQLLRVVGPEDANYAKAQHLLCALDSLPTWQDKDVSTTSLLRCCSVLQCVAVCCSVLQCVDTPCVRPRLAAYMAEYGRVCHFPPQVLHGVWVCCIVLHCVAVCCSVLQCRLPSSGLAVLCSVLQCVVVC